jgi:hypothetical protein
VCGVGGALKAIKVAILLEERIASQSKKLEKLALNIVEMDKRLAALEGRMEGFIAAASAFGRGSRRPARAIDAAPKEQPGIPPAQER